MRHQDIESAPFHTHSTEPMSSSKIFKGAKKDRRVMESTLLIGGVEVHVFYRSDMCNPMELPTATHRTMRAKIMFLLHGRTRSYEDSAAMGKKVLEEYYDDEAEGSPETDALIIVVWDQRNHGKRCISAVRNSDWESGNELHAEDMVSIIDAGVMELKSIADYLPAYLPGYKSFSHVTKIVTGVSMGAHEVIRAIVRFPNHFQAAIPIVGTFDLTTLMLKRLEPSLQGTTLYIHSYGILSPRLGSDADRYPEELFNITSEEDSRVARLYDTKRTKTLAMFGSEDTTVPYEYSVPFLEAIGQDLQENPEHVNASQPFQAIVYPCGHMITDAMLRHAAEFVKHL